MEVPVSLAGLAVMWLGALVLVTWRAEGGPVGAGLFGLMASAAAAAWTVLYGVKAQHDMLRNAFELGQDSARAENVHQLVDR